MKTIKKIVIGLTVVLTTSVMFVETIKAQDEGYLKVVEFGVRYLPTFTSLDLRTESGGIIKGSATMEHGFGVNLGLNLTSHFDLQGEINYNQVSQKYKDVNVNLEVIIRYLNVPLLLSLNTNKSSRINLNFVAGPQFGFNVGTKMTTSGSGNTGTLNAIVAVKKADVGFAYGAGLEFAINPQQTSRLDIGYRGFYGIVDMNGSADSGSYNVIVSSARKSQGGYIGFTFLF